MDDLATLSWRIRRIERLLSLPNDGIDTSEAAERVRAIVFQVRGGYDLGNDGAKFLLDIITNLDQRLASVIETAWSGP